MKYLCVKAEKEGFAFSSLTAADTPVLAMERSSVLEDHDDFISCYSP
jgi:hypothetical protein